jgi:hypothetical protein
MSIQYKFGRNLQTYYFNHLRVFVLVYNFMEEHL